MHNITIGKLTLISVSVGSLSIFSYLLSNDKNEDNHYTSSFKRTYSNINDDVKTISVKGRHIKGDPIKEPVMDYGKRISPAVYGDISHDKYSECLIISNLNDIYF
tara:strand:- start:322 stop:636 length:315 start_codon:yes stop_codon:yes gene_type:complete